MDFVFFAAYAAVWALLNYAGRFDGKLASKTWMDETTQ